MKKNFIAMGVMLAATLTLTNCAKEIQNPDEGKTPYTIYAEAADTKTANEGLSTVWTEGDALNVFHAPANTTEYSENTQFTLTDAATGKFDTEELKGELTASNDWYVLYPYSSYVKTPASTNSGYIDVGAKSIEQNGYDNMEHLSGKKCPLYGVAKGVSSQTLPGLTMHQLTSVVKVEVTNNAGKPITISNVALTAPQPIVGTFYVNFAGEELDFTPSGETYVSSIATLTVKGATELSAGKTATFYIPVKPFTADVNSDLVLSVNGGEGKTLTMSKDVSFEAGSIKTLKYSMDEVVEQEVLTIDDVIAADNNAQVLTAGLVVGTYARGVLIQDETGYLLVYDGSKAPAEVGDMIEVSGTKTTYSGLAQIGSPVVTVKSSGNKVTRPAATVLDGAAMDEKLSATAVSYIEYTGVLKVSGSYYNVAVDGASTAIGSLSYPDASLGLSELNGKTIKVTGYFVGVSSSMYVNTMVVAVEEVAGEEPEPEPGVGELTHPLTSNLKWTANKDNKSYSDKVIINETEYDALKLGTSSVVGVATVTIPTGTTKVGFYGVAWNGKKGTVTASIESGTVFFTQELVSNAGASNTSPYTIATPSDSDYYEIDVVSLLGAAPTSDITVTLSSVSGATRLVIWGLNYYIGSELGPDQSGSEAESTTPTSSGKKTVKEFIEAGDTENYYELTGKVSNFNANFCSFDLTDDSGTIYVYSLLAESKSEWSSKILDGGTVTLYGKYLYYEKSSKHEVVDAHIVNFTPGAIEPEEPEVEPAPEGSVIFDYETISTVTSSVGGVEISCVANDGNSPAYNSNSKELRIYRYNSFTLASEKNIESVIITFSDASRMGYQISVDSGEYVSDATSVKGTWTGSSKSVTFTNNGDSEHNIQARIKKIVVILAD